jgi:hypothetical protein
VSAMLFLKPCLTMTCVFCMHFFGMARSHNDINVLRRSLVFGKLAEGHAHVINCEVNGYR